MPVVTRDQVERAKPHPDLLVARYFLAMVITWRRVLGESRRG